MNYFSNCPRGLKGQCRIYLHILIYEIFTEETLSLRQNIPYNLKIKTSHFTLKSNIKETNVTKPAASGSSFPANLSQTLKR